jgi:hypothetical protein
MAKLDFYAQYYYGNDVDDDCGYDEYDCDSDYDKLKWAFGELCELDIRPGRNMYGEYIKIKNKQKMYRDKTLNKNGMQNEEKNSFWRK